MHFGQVNYINFREAPETEASLFFFEKNAVLHVTGGKLESERVRVYCPKKNVQGYSVARLYQFKEQTKNDYKIIPSLPIPREIADGRLPLREIRRPSYRHCAP